MPWEMVLEEEAADDSQVEIDPMDGVGVVFDGGRMYTRTGTVVPVPDEVLAAYSHYTIRRFASDKLDPPYESIRDLLSPAWSAWLGKIVPARSFSPDKIALRYALLEHLDRCGFHWEWSVGDDLTYGIPMYEDGVDSGMGGFGFMEPLGYPTVDSAIRELGATEPFPPGVLLETRTGSRSVIVLQPLVMGGLPFDSDEYLLHALPGEVCLYLCRDRGWMYDRRRNAILEFDLPEAEKCRIDYCVEGDHLYVSTLTYDSPPDIRRLYRIRISNLLELLSDDPAAGASR